MQDNIKAFNTGYLEALAGRSNENPFPLGTLLHQEYNDGYDEAKDLCVCCGQQKGVKS